MTRQIAPLLEILEQLATVVESLSAEQYARQADALSGSSIGAHVRHCLNHVEAVLEAADSGDLDYDRRQRGTAIETDPKAALRSIRGMVTRLDGLRAELLGRPVVVRAMLSASSPPEDLPSSLVRELAYVISHTTHHNAIIALLVRAVGGATPARFGYAASTLAWMRETRCAR